MNVLFVDIETSICELVGVELRELGYDVECLEFSSGALRAAQAGHVDVVILDVPASPDARRSAYKLADELRRDGIAVFFTSTLHPNDVISRHRDRGVLSKPYGVKQIDSWIEALGKDCRGEPAGAHVR